VAGKYYRENIMRRLLWVGFATLLLLAPQKTNAAHLLEIGVMVNGNIDLPRLTDSTGASPQSVSPKFGVGFGGLVYIPVMPFFEFETGILYVSHNFAVTPAITLNAQQQFSFNNLMFPR